MDKNEQILRTVERLLWGMTLIVKTLPESEDVLDFVADAEAALTALNTLHEQASSAS